MVRPPGAEEKEANRGQLKDATANEISQKFTAKRKKKRRKEKGENGGDGIRSVKKRKTEAGNLSSSGTAAEDLEREHPGNASTDAKGELISKGAMDVMRKKRKKARRSVHAENEKFESDPIYSSAREGSAAVRQNADSAVAEPQVTAKEVDSGETKKRKHRNAKRGRAPVAESGLGVPPRDDDTGNEVLAEPSDASGTAARKLKKRKTKKEIHDSARAGTSDPDVLEVRRNLNSTDNAEKDESDDVDGHALDGNIVAKDSTAAQQQNGDPDKTDPRLGRTLFVGNVSQKATQKDIKKIFKPFGSVETVRIRGVIPVNPKIPKRSALLGNQLASFSDSFQAYVVFKETETVSNAMDEACKQLNMTVFMDRHIRVMPASHKRNGSRRQSLFLGNLPFDCSEEDIIVTFQEIATKLGVEIINARVNKDVDTGVGRGVGFVTFSDTLGVQGCLNASGDIKIGGRVVRMEPATKMKKLNTKEYKRNWKAGGKKESVQLYWQGAGSKYMSSKSRSAKPANHPRGGEPAKEDRHAKEGARAPGFRHRRS